MMLFGVPIHERCTIIRKLNVLKRASYRCAYCHKDLLTDPDSFFSSTIDHFLPRVHGGTDRWHNKLPCCAMCNRLKANAVVGNVGEARELIAVRRAVYVMHHALMLAELRPRLSAPAKGGAA